MLTASEARLFSMVTLENVVTDDTTADELEDIVLQQAIQASTATTTATPAFHGEADAATAGLVRANSVSEPYTPMLLPSPQLASPALPVAHVVEAPAEDAAAELAGTLPPAGDHGVRRSQSPVHGVATAAHDEMSALDRHEFAPFQFAQRVGCDVCEGPCAQAGERSLSWAVVPH